VDPVTRRRRIVVLVPHEPTLDPRIHYTAQSLGREHDVTVVATALESEARPETNRPVMPSYECIRLQYRKRHSIRAVYAFFRLWVEPSRGRGRAMTLLTAPLALVLLILTGMLALAVVAAGAVFELVMLPWMLMRHERPFIIRPILHLLKRGVLAVVPSRHRTDSAPASSSSRDEATAAPAPPRLTTSPRENVTRGLRVLLSVLRFTFSANALLWRHVATRPAPDVVYCHDLYGLQTGVRLKRAYGARLVYDSHEYYPYQYPFWCYAPVIRLYESILLRDVDDFITVSPQLAAELSRVYGIVPIHALPNVDPRPLPAVRNTVTDMTRLAAGRLRLLFQGTFAEGRGLEEVVASWPRVDGTRIALFLRGPRNPWLERLEWQAQELGLLGRSIFVLPPVLERDLIGAAREADIGLIPYKTDWLSYRFACPNKLSQYLHAGLAILSNRLVFVEHVIREGKLGLSYDVRSSESFVQAIERLVDDPRAVDEFKKNAVTYAEQEYNWERYERVLLNLVASER
jgi:glycosyltransferase involved in cell wall biosynthesis